MYLCSSGGSILAGNASISGVPFVSVANHESWLLEIPSSPAQVFATVRTKVCNQHLLQLAWNRVYTQVRTKRSLALEMPLTMQLCTGASTD